ncbi:MAG: DUF1289 domain-containing protein [Rhodobacteraceae bacterium]|nr:DUF1289 domain-containing protein [Paracoccaceae bacterium]
MSDDIWARDEIESPCRKVCVIHEDSGLCMGCYRSRAEIATWSRMEPQTRRAIMAELADRALLIQGRRRGGRARNTADIG